jgi:hypothetical protein
MIRIAVTSMAAPQSLLQKMIPQRVIKVTDTKVLARKAAEKIISPPSPPAKHPHALGPHRLGVSKVRLEIHCSLPLIAADAPGASGPHVTASTLVALCKPRGSASSLKPAS